MFEEILEDLNNRIEVRSNLIELKKMLTSEENVYALKSEKLYDVSLFKVLFDDEDAKVRKNVALIAGVLEEPELAEIIYSHYLTEGTLFVRSSYLTALARYDCTPYMETLAARKREIESGDIDDETLKHLADELKALKVIVKEDGAHHHHVFREPKTPVNVILAAKKSAATIIKEMYPNATENFMGFMIKTSSIKKLFTIRVFRDIYFPLNGLKSYDKAELAKAICEGNLLKLLDELHESSCESFYFRITSKDVDVAELGARISALSKGRLENSADNYEIEIKLIKGSEGRFGCLLRLYTLRDKRFAYRQESLSTSMHPSDAALMVRLADEYIKSDVQIIDPMCGVGTLLIERMKLRKATYVYGVDVFGDAIERARVNSTKAGIVINYINRNYFEFKHDYPFDEIITQLPEINGEGEDQFYRQFFVKSDEILKKNGIIIVNSKRKNLIKKHIRLAKHYKLLREYVMNEREESCVYVIEKQ